MKALVGAFNQEKALVGAFSVIVKTDCETDGSICGTTRYPGRGRAQQIQGYKGQSFGHLSRYSKFLGGRKPNISDGVFLFWFW